VLPRFGPEVATAWLAVVLLLLALSTFGNNWLRSVFSTNEMQFMLLASAVWVILAIDQVLATFVVNDISSFVFSQILMGDISLVALVAALTAFAVLASTFALARGLREPPPDVLDTRRPMPILARLEDFGKVGALALMECRLMARNKRPRHYLIMAFLFSTAYLMLILVNERVFDPVVFGSVIGLFASGGFVLNYGQLMFSWESGFFDGLLQFFDDLARDRFSPRDRLSAYRVADSPEEALACLLEAKRLCVLLDSPRRHAETLVNEAAVHISEGRVSHARAIAEAAQKLAQEARSVRLMHLAVGIEVDCHLADGDPDAACLRFDEAISIDRAADVSLYAGTIERQRRQLTWVRHGRTAFASTYEGDLLWELRPLRDRLTLEALRDWVQHQEGMASVGTVSVLDRLKEHGFRGTAAYLEHIGVGRGMGQELSGSS